jgi:tetratricopeptide (TPR) repeat protein
MITDDFRFAPVEMHEDARQRVGFALGRDPTRSEVSAWYRGAALREWIDAPGDSAAFFAHKLRWFLSPAEPPSSADLATDTERVPWLRAACVPTWLLAALAIVGAWLGGRDRALLLGAGGLVVAHAVTCMLAFPLSHYRAPAIPALAILAGVGVAEVLRGAKRDRNGAIRLLLIGTIAAWFPPQPGDVEAVLHANRANDAIQARDAETALREGKQAFDAEPHWTGALLTMANAHLLAGNLELARAHAELAVRRQPWNVAAVRFRALLDLDLRQPDAAVAAAEALVKSLPWSAEARGVRGEIRAFTGNILGAKEDLAWAMERGHRPRPEVLAQVGMPPR